MPNPLFAFAVRGHEPIEITSITPDHGPEEGGTDVSIVGRGFLGAGEVRIATFRDPENGTNVTDLVIVNDNLITCKTPEKPMFGGSPANVYVVRNPYEVTELAAVLSSGFTYDEP